MSFADLESEPPDSDLPSPASYHTQTKQESTEILAAPEAGEMDISGADANSGDDVGTASSLSEYLSGWGDTAGQISIGTYPNFNCFTMILYPHVHR